MRILLLIGALALVSFGSTLAQQAPPANLQGEALRNWLYQNWYQGHHQTLGYDAARRAMYSYVDKQDDGQVYCVYTGYSQPAQNTTFLNPINAEHTVPQSFFSEADPMVSDIFHLFPTHKDVNAERGSFPFDEIPDNLTDSWYTAENNVYRESYSIPGTAINEYSELDNGLRFEPREQHKGDLARAVFYFYTMYPTQAGPISRIVHSSLETLYQWHLNDPVSDWEVQRNQRVQERQGNQNPYVAYPDLVCRAWGFSCSGGTAPIVASQLPDFGTLLYQSGQSEILNYALTLYQLSEDLTITASTHFALSTQAEGPFSRTITLPAATTSQTIYVKFEPESAVGGPISGTLTHTSGSQQLIITVNGTEGDANLQPYTVLTEDFSNCGTTNWVTYSQRSNRDWTCGTGRNGSGYYANGFRANEASADWLISPAVAVEAGQPLTLQAWVYTQYAGPPLQMLYSTNHTEGANPDQANWQELDVNLPAANSRQWTAVTATFSPAATRFHVAFKYTSNGVNAGEAAAWSVDDIALSVSPQFSPAFARPAATELSYEPVAVSVFLNQKTPEPQQVRITATEGAELLGNGPAAAVLLSENLSGNTFSISIPAGDSVAQFQLTVQHPPAQASSLRFKIESLNERELPYQARLNLQVPTAEALGWSDKIVSLPLVYPNPVKQGSARLHLEQIGAAGGTVLLYNMQGKLVWRAELQRHMNLPDNLPNGSYQLLVNQGHIVFIQKILIQK